MAEDGLIKNITLNSLAVSNNLTVTNDIGKIDNNLNIGEDLNVVRDVNIQGKIKGDVVIGEDSTDLMIVNSTNKFNSETSFNSQININGSIDSENIFLGNWSQLGADINGERNYDESGVSVSLSSDGTIVAIGAPNHHGDEDNYDSGHVRVYQYDSTKTTDETDQTSPDFGPVGWRRLGQDIDGEGMYDESGASVSLSSDGTIVAIGAQFNDPWYGDDSGHVRIYKYDATKTDNITDQTSPNFGPVGWRRLGQDIDGERNYDESGVSVSLSSDGTIVAIGAIDSHYVNGKSFIWSGHVRVYQWRKYTDSDSGVYHHTTRIQDSTQTKPLIITGYTTIDGNIEGIQPTAGNYYWTQLGFDIDGEFSDDKSGISVSLSSDGTIVAIGANGNDANGSSTDSGHVRVYKWRQYTQTDNDNDTYYYTSKIQDGIQTKPLIITGYTTTNEGDIEGTEPIVGNYYWTQLGADIDGETNRDSSGISVSLSSDGTIVAIGAQLNDGDGQNYDSGHVRVYKYDATKTTNETDQTSSNFGPVGWRRLGADINGEGNYDSSGISVSLSSDGTIVAIGANGNDSNRGHVRVYKYDATKTNSITDQNSTDFGPVGWRRLGIDIDGEATDDESGISVSLSSDGTIVAIGAPNNDGSNTNSGHVRVHKINTYTGLNINSYVGIGVTNPSEKLEVDGNVKIDGKLNLNINNLPTSSAGLLTGDIYVDENGFLKIFT